MYQYHIFFIQPSVDWHLGCFHIFVIVNNTGMKIRVNVYFSISVFIFFRCISKSEIARSYGSSSCGPIDDSHSFRWEVIAHCGSDLHFPDD